MSPRRALFLPLQRFFGKEIVSMRQIERHILILTEDTIEKPLVKLGCERKKQANAVERTDACIRCKKNFHTNNKPDLADAMANKMLNELILHILLRFKDPKYRTEDENINEILNSLNMPYAAQE